MEIKEKSHPKGKIYFLTYDNGLPIMAVYNFMLHIINNNGSINTNKSYCERLKLYFEWLEKQSLTYLSAVENKSDILSNLSAFKFWLKYPNYNQKVTPIEGYTAARSAKTINAIMSTVLSFYDYLSLRGEVQALDIYKEVRNNSQFGKFLGELTLKKEKTFMSVLKDKEPKNMPKHITPTQYELLWNKASNHRNRIIIGLMFEGGLRVSEVIGLNIYDLREIYDNRIYITKRADINNPDAFVKYNSEGYVQVSDRLTHEINDYLENTLMNINTNYVIINLYGSSKEAIENRYKPMRRKTIEKMVLNLGKQCGINNLHPHMLRHGLAVDLIAKGASMEEVCDILRHSDPSTTKKVYALADKPTRQKIMERYYEKANKDFHPENSTMEELVEFLKNDMED